MYDKLTPYGWPAHCEKASISSSNALNVPIACTIFLSGSILRACIINDRNDLFGSLLVKFTEIKNKAGTYTCILLQGRLTERPMALSYESLY